jgi:hypothetical protein
MQAYTNNSQEWMKKTMRPNENKLRVTQGALERSGSLPTRTYVLGKVLHSASLAPPAMAKDFLAVLHGAANPFIRSIYIPLHGIPSGIEFCHSFI